MCLYAFILLFMSCSRCIPTIFPLCSRCIPPLSLIYSQPRSHYIITTLFPLYSSYFCHVPTIILPYSHHIPTYLRNLFPPCSLCIPTLSLIYSQPRSHYIIPTWFPLYSHIIIVFLPCSQYFPHHVPTIILPYFHHIPNYLPNVFPPCSHCIPTLSIIYSKPRSHYIIPALFPLCSYYIPIMFPLHFDHLVPTVFPHYHRSSAWFPMSSMFPYSHHIPTYRPN